MNDSDNKSQSALQYALKSHNVVAAMTLLEDGASIEGKNDEGRTVLHLSAEYGNEKLFELLMKNNANVNDRDNKGQSALYYSIASSNVLAAMNYLKLERV